MKTTTKCGLVLCLALGPSFGRAEQPAGDRALAAALETRLKALELEGQSCGRGVQHVTAQNASACEKRIDTERLNIKAILSNPARLRQESDRLRNEFRQELLVLLAEVSSASAMLSAQSDYDQFTLKIATIGDHLQVIRSKYGIPLSLGDHKALGMPISDAYSALYAGASDWKQLRLAAKEVVEAQAARARAAAWEADYFQQHLKAAQIRHADAQKHLADHTATALALVRAATRVAQEEPTKEQAITVKR
jgi:hypothetical protein